jgi:hypothetical protein
MRLNSKGLALATVFGACLLTGCGGGEVATNAGGEQPAAPAAPAKPVGPLADNAYRAQITVADPPTRLRAGQKLELKARVKNASDAAWTTQPQGAEGNKFVVAIMNNWLKPDGALVTNMDGRYGVGQEVPPGGEVELPLTVTAPKERGEYILELDLVQEQVAMFKDKGSETLKLKVRVE